MKKKILIGSIIAVAIIVLSSFSSVVGKVSSDDDRVEFDVEFCGLGKKHTVQLTQEEADEVELLFDEIRTKLDNVESRDEAGVVFKEAVVELNQYGLLPKGMSVEQAQKLVVGEYSKDKGLSIFEKVSHENSIQENQYNFFCFVSGIVYDGYATGQLGMIGGILALLGVFGILDVIGVLGVLLMVISEIIVTVFPLSIMQSITIFSANIISLGILGFKNHTIPPHSGTAKIFGFNGIKLTNIETGEINLLGFALAVIDLSND